MRIPVLMLCLIFLTSQGCSREAGGPEPQTALELPAVDQLPLARDLSFTDSDRRKSGDQYVSALPFSHVTDLGTQLEFAPQADGVSLTLNDYAFALYRFVLPGYGDNGTVQFNWSGGAPEGRAWAALANRQTDHWDWLPMSLDGRIDFDSLLPYLEADNLIVAVVVGGSDPALLSSIVIGDNAVPFAFVTIDVDNGDIPLTVNFSGEQSTDSDGDIVRYEWDFDDDGVYDLDSGGDPLVTHTYDVAGSYTPRMRVTDDKGAQSRDGENVSATAPGMVPPVADLTATPPTGNAPLQVTLDASGSTDDVGIVNYDWDFDGDGTYELLDSAQASVVHEFEAGIWMPVVRVQDADGATDTASAQLDSNASPVVVFNSYPECSGAKQRTLNAAGSYEPGGSIVQYRWDFDGDGTWDSTTSAGAVQHDYAGWSTYIPRVEVTDDDGEVNATYGDQLHIFELAEHHDSRSDYVTGAAPDVAMVGARRWAAWESETGEFPGIYFNRATDGGFYSGPLSQTHDAPNASSLSVASFYSSGGTQLACIAFYSSSGDMMCARAKESEPQNSGDWVIGAVQNDSSAFKGNYDCDMVSVGSGTSARIMVSYYDSIDGELYFAVAQNSTPDSDNDWTRHIVDTSGDCGREHCMALIGGKPAICYLRTEGSVHSVRYVRSTVEKPDDAGDWVSMPLTGASTLEFHGMSLTHVSGNPVISLMAGNDLKYLKCGSPTPDDINDWTTTSVVQNINCAHTSLVNFNSFPIIAFSISSTKGGTIGLGVARSQVLDPSGEGSWCTVTGLREMTKLPVAAAVNSAGPIIAYYGANRFGYDPGLQLLNN